MSEAVDQGVGNTETSGNSTDVRITLLRTVLEDPRAAKILSVVAGLSGLDISDERRKALLRQVDDAVKPGRSYDDIMRDSNVAQDFPEFSRADGLVRTTGVLAGRALEIYRHTDNDFAKRQREVNGQTAPAEEPDMFTPDSILNHEVFSPAVTDVIKANGITDTEEIAAYEKAGADLAKLYVAYHKEGHRQREEWNMAASSAFPRTGDR